jgi:hypothetical protein
MAPVAHFEPVTYIRDWQGWLCRLITEELEEDYQVLDITSRVECIPPRVRYEYTPAKFRKKYIKNWCGDNEFQARS